MIPWDTFKTPQDAYDWALLHSTEFASVPVLSGWALVSPGFNRNLYLIDYLFTGFSFSAAGRR